MEFNIPKCNIIPVTTLCNESNYIYSMNDTPLQTVEQHLYLGVYLHHKMSWQPQVDYVCNKANPYSMLFVEKLRGSSRTLQKASYLHFVLPILDYCCTIWDPYHQTSMHKLEMIQHCAAHFVLNKPWRRTNHDSITDILEMTTT